MENNQQNYGENSNKPEELTAKKDSVNLLLENYIWKNKKLDAFECYWEIKNIALEDDAIYGKTPDELIDYICYNEDLDIISRYYEIKDLVPKYISLCIKLLMSQKITFLIMKTLASYKT